MTKSHTCLIHFQAHSWDQSVISNVDKVSCSGKQSWFKLGLNSCLTSHLEVTSQTYLPAPYTALQSSFTAASAVPEDIGKVFPSQTSWYMQSKSVLSNCLTACQFNHAMSEFIEMGYVNDSFTFLSHTIFGELENNQMFLLLKMNFSTSHLQQDKSEFRACHPSNYTIFV